MNAFKTLLAAAMVAGMGTVPLFAQDPQPSMSGEGLTRLQIEAKVTKVDQDANIIFVEARGVPGTKGTEFTLPYLVTDATQLEKFKNGDKVIADVIVTDNGPTVEGIRAIGDVKATPPISPIDAQRDALKSSKTGKEPASETNNDTTKTDPPQPAEDHSRFTGKVSSVNLKTRQITILADSLPGLPRGVATVPYTVPETINIEIFHKGDLVTGELVVSQNATFVDNVQIGNGIPEESSASPLNKTDDGIPRNPSQHKDPSQKTPY